MRYIWLIPLLPGLGALVNGVVGIRAFSRRASGLLACATMTAAFGLSLAAFWQLLALPSEARAYDVVVAQWIPKIPLATHNGFAAFEVPWGFRLDPLSGLMLLVVTGIGTLIHIYSTAYMADEPRGGVARFFCYLNLFCFFMLMLVLGNNFLVMFVGWEGVGLCSYLLIGYWYEKKSASDAGKKAFITNRVGDWGFVLGIFLVYFTFGTLNFREVQNAAGAMPVETAHFGVLSWICLLLFIGATGKSAQIPLYVWLPDAMEGPTPVSALIHAATMVTAGVYMVARCSVLYLMAPAALSIVAIIGALTAIFAASIALVQNDIKRVLAYSTISQLGYMFLACGVGAFTAAIFHLATHAFFKALLFLGAGSVIHALGGEQDIRRMGGLKAHLPVTYATFLIAALAIAGIFPFAGFFSKDEILWAALTEGHFLVWLLAAMTAVMTSFYMFRLVFLVFHGQPRAKDLPHHPHEAPVTMRVPLMVLAGLSAVAGFIGMPIIEGANLIRAYLEPVFTRDPLPLEAIGHAVHRPGLELVMLLISLALAMGGILLAVYMYLLEPALPERLSARFQRAYRVLLDNYYVDELYDRLVVEPVKRASGWLWAEVDVGVVDG